MPDSIELQPTKTRKGSPLRDLNDERLKLLSVVFQNVIAENTDIHYIGTRQDIVAAFAKLGFEINEETLQNQLKRYLQLDPRLQMAGGRGPYLWVEAEPKKKRSKKTEEVTEPA